MSDLLEGLETGVFYYGGILFVLLYFLRLWLRGPTTGSDNPKRLDGKVVVITGKLTWILIYFNLPWFDIPNWKLSISVFWSNTPPSVADLVVCTENNKLSLEDYTLI